MKFVATAAAFLLAQAAADLACKTDDGEFDDAGGVVISTLNLCILPCHGPHLAQPCRAASHRATPIPPPPLNSPRTSDTHAPTSPLRPPLTPLLQTSIQIALATSSVLSRLMATMVTHASNA